MANREDIALMAHLIRRAGFGATRDELEYLVEQGYEETVEALLHPEDHRGADEYLLYRYHPLTELPGGGDISAAQAHWLYHMVNTGRPLQEKMALFWHHVFATAESKLDAPNVMRDQIQMFREYGMGNYRELLVRLARDPAMIYWLDNSENHKDAPNENWGRELLELFSLGVGNYTERDVFECSRAFTGWTIKARMPDPMFAYPYGRFPWLFEFRPEDHDDSEKTFLGHTGGFDGEGILDIIVQQPACHSFISRHICNFFVADEPQVAAWNIESPRDPEAINLLSETFVGSGYEMTPVLRTLFNSDFFKEAIYQKVKSPIEVVAGTLRLAGMDGPHPLLAFLAKEAGYMGQDIINPPSVEGWHTGKEWVNGGSLVRRVNFVADRLADTDSPGVQSIIRRVASHETAVTAEALVDRCLDLMGPLEVDESTRRELVAHAESVGPIAWATDEEYAGFSRRVGDMLGLIAATVEYQYT